MYDVIELIGTSNELWKRPPPMRSSRPPNLSAIFASQKSSSSMCNWTRRERWKPTARRSSYRSNTRSALALSAGPPEPKSQRCPGARVRNSALLACFTPRISVYGFPTTQANEVVAPIHPEAMSCDPDHR